MSLLCPYTCDWHTHFQILSNWRSPYLRPSIGFANRISQYLTKFSSLCLNGSMYTLHCLTHTMVLTYLVHRSHIMSTVLYSSRHLIQQNICLLHKFVGSNVWPCVTKLLTKSQSEIGHLLYQHILAILPLKRASMVLPTHELLSQSGKNNMIEVFCEQIT